jgi:hypothetical protein
VAKSTSQPANPSAWLIRQYTDAAARLRDMILHPTGKTAAAQEFRRGRAAQQLQQIDKIVTQLKGSAARFVAVDLAAFYMTGLKSAITQARDAGIRPRSEVRGQKSEVRAASPSADLFAGSFSLIDRRSIEVLSRDTYNDLSKSIDSMKRNAETVLRHTQQLNLPERDINRILAGGIIEGKPAQAIRQLRDELIRVNDGRMVEVNGRHYDAAKYAKTVVVTKTREAVETARSERLQELGIDLVMVIGRESDNFCSEFLGQVFSLSGKSTKYPALESMPGKGPPFHPNCSKSTRAFVEELATPAQLREAQPTPDTLAMVGMKTTDAQRAYTDLQMRPQAEQRNRRSANSIKG